MSKWIDFKLQPKNPERKTNLWVVYTKDGRMDLGHVEWFSRWRCYVFFPSMDTVFERDCLRDIANFIEQQTKDYKETISRR